MARTNGSSSEPALATAVGTAVLATDFSHAALGAANAAKFVRDALGAEIVVVTAIEGVDEESGPSEEKLRAWRMQVERDTHDYLEDHGLGGCRIEVVDGEASASVLAARKRHKADLVIIGRRGSHDSTEGTLGTTARRLVRKCPVSVLVARREFSGEVQAVGAATDFSHEGERAVRRAAMLAREHGLKRFEVLHSAEESSGAFAAYTQEEFLELRTETANTRMQSLVRTLMDAGGPEVGLHVRGGRTAGTIAQMSQELGLDVLCVGTHGMGGTPMLLGSTAERVLEVTPCSIWLERASNEHMTLIERLADFIS